MGGTRTAQGRHRASRAHDPDRNLIRRRGATRNDDRTQNDLGHRRRSPSRDQMRMFLAKQRNAGRPLFEFALRPAAELWHRARDAVKEALGQPFSSTPDPPATGVTVTATAASASATSTSTLSFSLPSLVVWARVSR